MKEPIKINDDNYCPVCGEHIDGVTSVGGDYTPQEGDVSVCANCTAFLMFDDRLLSRLIDPDTLLSLPDDLLFQLSSIRLQLKQFEEYRAQQSEPEDE